MIPIVTAAEMAAIDAAAPEPVEVLIGRAGAATARAAVGLLGGGYGRRVLVVAGKGNNGNDGRAAARLLGRRGVRCEVIGPRDPWRQGRSPVDLVIDAAYGTGFKGSWTPPVVGDTPVLAVDIPSGVDATTGTTASPDGALGAVATVTFAALKPGLVLAAGARLAGSVSVADIGLDVSCSSAWLVEADDVGRWVPRRSGDAHKWRSACLVVAGSPGMPGAVHLASRAAYRAGAGYVRLSTPGGGPCTAAPPVEVVSVPVPAAGWSGPAQDDVARFASAVVGPGLGSSSDGDAEIRRFVAGCPVPLVVDGDALTAWGRGAGEIIGRRSMPTILTPHDGEFARLTGAAPGPDRFGAARQLATSTGAVVLLKGPTTLVAAPDGAVLASNRGDARLATAGTGDVLSGIVGSLLAQGVDAWRAAAVGAWVHGEAATLGPRRGLVAGDLIDALPAVWSGLRIP